MQNIKQLISQGRNYSPPRLTQEKIIPILRFLSGVSALLLLSTTLFQFTSAQSEDMPYLQSLVIFYLFLAALIILVVEFAPGYVFENYLVEWLPFLGTRYGKAFMHLVASTFMFDSQVFNGEHVPNVYGGISLLMSGIFWFLFYYSKVEANPSDYRGFQHPSTDLALIIRTPFNQEIKPSIKLSQSLTESI